MVVNKQRNFEETKRTPHYGLRKLNVGVVSVLLGVTVFGINVALDPAKAAANAAVPQSVTETNTPTGSGQNTAPAGSGQNPASAGSGQNPASAGSGQNPASVDENNINTQTQAKNNQLAKETGLTSSDNSSSNIYMGTDGNYYKVVTIYGNDYVYRPVKVYANGTATGQYATNERDTRTNIVTSKEDLGNGKVHWKITFFPAKGLTKYKSTLSGLQSAKFGVALTKDYKIIGDVTVNIDSIADAHHTYTAMTGHGSRDDHEFTPEARVVQSFNPNTDVDLSGWINSSTMPGENNDYILGPYYFTTENSVGKQNLGNTFFKEATVNNNVYTQEPFVGGVHDLWTDNYTIRNENKNALDGGDYVNKHLIYDPLYNGRYDHTDGFFNSDDFGSAMIFKSHGKTGTAQFASFTISFDTQHTDSYQSELAKGPKDRPQQFSGIIANTYSYQDAYYNMYSISLGEQRSLKKVGAKYVPNEPGDVVSNWKKGQEALAKINQKYLNKAQIDTLSNAIHSNIDDEDTVDQIITIGNKLNDAMKALGNSVGQYDDQKAYTDHVVDTVKQSDRYLNADKAKRSLYDQAVEAAQKVLDKEKGQYAKQTKVEELTKAVNDAWKALNGSTIPTKKVVVADPLKLTSDELEQIKQKVAAVNPETTVEVAPDGSVTIKRGDQVLTPIAGDQLVIGQTKVNDLKNLTPTEQGEVKQKVSTAYQSLGVTNVTISNDGTATVTLQRTVTLPSESVTIPGTDLVVKKTDTEKYTAETGAPVDLQHGKTVAIGDKLDPSAVVIKDQNGSQVELPDGAKVVWTEAPDTSEIGDGKTGQAKVIYGDGTESEPVTVTYNVKPNQADTNTPTTDKISVEPKTALTADDATKTITNLTDLPAGTTVAWKPGTTVDTNTPGDKPGKVVVSYPDGSSEEVGVTVHVKGQDEQNAPEGGQVEVKKGDTATDSDAKKAITNSADLPDGTKYSFKDPVNTKDSGDKDATVVVTYPDGTSKEVPVKVHVPNDTETYTAVAKEGINVYQNDKLDPETLVVAKDKNGTDTVFPDGTKFEWTTEPDTTNVGTATGTVTVTYPDRTTDTVHVSVNVKPTPANKEYKLEAHKGIVVDKNTKLNPAEVIDVKDADSDKTVYPAGTTYEWETEPDTSKPGNTMGTVKVTYGDGTVATTEVTVHVRSDADNFDPEKQTVTVNKDDTPSAKDAIANSDKMPVGPDGTETKYEWTGDSIDTTTPGDKTGTVRVTYPDGSSEEVSGVTVHVNSDTEQYDAQAGKVPDVPRGVELKEVPAGTVVAKNKDGKQVDFPKGTTLTWEQAPDTSKTGNATGKVKVTYPDGTDTVDVTVNVVPNDADKNDANAADGVTTDLNKVPDAKDAVTVTDPDGKPVTDFEAEWAKDKTPDVTKPGKSTGTVEITYPDGSKDTVEVPVTVRDENGKTQADKNDANAADGVTTDLNKVPDAKGAVTVTDPDGKPVTDFEANWKEEPDVTKPGKSTGTVEITYPDGSKDTVEVPVTVRDENGKTQADKNEPNLPKDKVEVDDPAKLTDDEKSQVEQAVKDANKDNFPEGTDVTTGDDGTTKVTYPDGSKDTIPGTKLVEKKTDTPTPTERTANVVFKGVDKKYDGKPAEVTVTITDQDGKDIDVTLEAGKDYTITKQSAAKARMLLATAKPLTDAPTEVGTYHVALTEAGKQKLNDAGYTTVNETPANFTISPADTPTPTPDTKTDDEKYDPIIPGDKVKVDDPTKLTGDEKGQVEQAVKDANKDNFPEGTNVTTGDDGTTVVTYPDGTKDTIDGDKLVEPANPSDTKTDDQTNDPKVPGDKVKVDDPTKLTNEEKEEVTKALEDANKDDKGDSTLPDGTKITIDDDGTATVTYPDGTKDTIDGDQLVEKKNDADKNEPNVPGDKVKVDDPTKLTDDEKAEVVKAVEDANKDKDGNSTLPDGTKITVGDNGDVTVTYPDGSKDTITGDKVVEGKDNGGETGGQDADKNEPNVPGDKVKVDDPTKLTDDEKAEVVKAVEDANKDKDGNSTLPDGTKITVGDNGDVTVTYPDGSKDTIPGDKVVEGKTDADKTNVTVPGTKVEVGDPTKLTDGEKGQVEEAIKDANPNLPDGTKITVGDDGTTTITYPDGSTNTIPGHDLVTGKTDADKYPLNPGQAVDVVDPNHLTQAEQDQVKEAIRTANPTAPIATITVDAAGNVQVTFADGSTTTLQANLHKHVTEATTGSATKPGAGTNGDQTKGATSPNQTATKQQAQQHLPQTGDQPATWAMLSGLGVAFLGLLGLKKKRED